MFFFRPRTNLPENPAPMITAPDSVKSLFPTVFRGQSAERSILDAKEVLQSVKSFVCEICIIYIKR